MHVALADGRWHWPLGRSVQPVDGTVARRVAWRPSRLRTDARWRACDQSDRDLPEIRGGPCVGCLDDLRRRGDLADDEECVLQPVQVRPAHRTIQFLEIRPTGERLKAFEATPKDEIPDPPCGAYGWSTHGRRYFLTDIRQPDQIL
jgi:hypothetical protein